MRLIMVTNGLLCFAAFAFPFSVAAANVGFGIALALGIVSGLWWQGAQLCWNNFRQLTIAFCAYFTLLLLGLFWSHDLGWGMHILGRHWFWLLIPVLVASLTEEQWRKYLLVSLSAGLALHLMFCVLQSFGYVHVTTDGSNADNATGHIGHIGFGFVYGIWASWLLYLGLLWRGKQRLIAWALAAWSYVMVLSAQGRSGYLIAMVLMLSIGFRWVLDVRNWRIAQIFIGIFILMLLVIALGPGKERLHGTWLAFTQAEHETLDQLDSSDNAVLATQSRFDMWMASLDIYLDNPVFGVGTGGLPRAAAELKAEGRSVSQFVFAHPHNQYLLVLVRWGPLGFMLFSILLLFWMREGWCLDWQKCSAAPLIFLPALALAVHALSSSSLEEHFSAILAALLLGAGLSDNRG